MANTPFELYEKAYGLHYNEKRIPEAAKIYEAIIQDFPDSNECGYAFIQLQKIKANAIGGRLKTGTGGPGPILLLACAISIIALLVAVAGTLLVFHELGQQRERTTLAVTVLAKMYGGKEREAQAIVDKIKSSGQEVLLAQELSSLVMEKRSLPAREAPAVAPTADSVAPVKAEAAAPPRAVDTVVKRRIPPRITGAVNPKVLRGVHPAETAKNPPVAKPDTPSYF